MQTAATDEAIEREKAVVGWKFHDKKFIRFKKGDNARFTQYPLTYIHPWTILCEMASLSLADMCSMPLCCALFFGCSIFVDQ